MMSNGVFVGGGEILRGGMGAKMEGGGGACVALRWRLTHAWRGLGGWGAACRAQTARWPEYWKWSAVKDSTTASC